MDIGMRLREERDRIGMTQEAFGQAGGVLKRALIRYEKGERMPDAEFLAAIAAAGADVLYVLTGQRMGSAAVTQPSLNTELLADAIELVEKLLTKTGRTFTPAKKAKHVAALYQAFSSGQEVDTNAIAAAMTRAA